MIERLAPTPEPPYWVVAFTSQRSARDAERYARIAAAMERLAPLQPGCLGIESARDDSGFGITLSYWRDEASILAWKALSAHAAAQREGHATWYEDFVVRIARVERAYTKATSPRTSL